jgi:hypothetical protein
MLWAVLGFVEIMPMRFSPLGGLSAMGLPLPLEFSVTSLEEVA